MLHSLNHKHIDQLKNSKDNHQRIAALKSFSQYQLILPSVIKKYHDLVLFYCCFPYNKTIYKLAEGELKRIAGIAYTMNNKANSTIKTALMASGIAHTELLCSYSRNIAQWLVNKFPGAAGLDSSDASSEKIITLFQLLLPSIEYQISSQSKLTLTARIKRASGLKLPAGQLHWLVQMFRDSQLPEDVKDELYQQLKIFIRWKLDNEIFSRTFLQLPVKKIWYQKKMIRNVNTLKIIHQKIDNPLLLSKNDKVHLLDVMKATLAFYYRETDPVTFADEEELGLFEVGRGVQIALVGMTKEKRLSLESYIGYMVFKNGIPVSYGGGWIWGQRCKIGVNIFPPFRGGESAWLFCQVLRIYYQHFSVHHFIVKPYQFGKENLEGLKSGAFWFYYKLGFRPAEEKINIIASEEWKKKTMDTKYSTPLKTLQQFTVCNAEWKTTKNTFPDFDAGELSEDVSNYINDHFKGSRKKAIAASIMKLKKETGSEISKNILSSNHSAAANWSLLTGLLKDLSQWKLSQKKDLIKLIHLKQSGKERDYIVSLQKHVQFWKSLQSLR